MPDLSKVETSNLETMQDIRSLVYYAQTSGFDKETQRRLYLKAVTEAAKLGANEIYALHQQFAELSIDEDLKKELFNNLAFELRQLKTLSHEDVNLVVHYAQTGDFDKETQRRLYLKAVSGAAQLGANDIYSLHQQIAKSSLEEELKKELFSNLSFEMCHLKALSHEDVNLVVHYAQTGDFDKETQRRLYLKAVSGAAQLGANDIYSLHQTVAKLQIEEELKKELFNNLSFDMCNLKALSHDEIGMVIYYAQTSGFDKETQRRLYLKAISGAAQLGANDIYSVHNQFDKIQMDEELRKELSNHLSFELQNLPQKQDLQESQTTGMKR